MENKMSMEMLNQNPYNTRTEALYFGNTGRKEIIIFRSAQIRV